MTNFPSDLDDDVTLPPVNDNLTEIGGEAINALREAVFAIEQEFGTGASGSAGSLAARIGVSLDASGNIKSSAITALGLVTLPITNPQIANNAGITESKLNLDHSTQDLFNFIQNTTNDVELVKNWVSTVGVKLDPHVAGTLYRHVLSQIDISTNPNDFFKSKSGAFRNNSNLYSLFSEVNKEFVAHQKANSIDFSSQDVFSPTVGTIPPSGYAHNASGLFVNTTNFSFIPQTNQSVQEIFQFIDSSSLTLLGSRTQNLYQSGISRASRSTVLGSNKHQLVVPSTSVVAYLKNSSNNPVDNIDTGDDIIEFVPAAGLLANFSFDNQFASVKAGDVLTINYIELGVVVSFLVKEYKVINGSTRRFIVRVNGKNLVATANATATINKPQFHTEKQGVLALASSQANSGFTGALPSLIVSSPRGASVLGIGFNPDLLDSQHYNLWLTIYPTGNPTQGQQLFKVDVTGNIGATPGKYTLESIVEATNREFRSNGFNYRFIAYSYQGEFGLALADHYNNASFSIISGILQSNGTYDPALSSTAYPNNVVDAINNIDPLGLGLQGANAASPPYSPVPSSLEIARVPTKIFVPLTKNTYYVDGVEKEILFVESGPDADLYGDTYWLATIVNKAVNVDRIQVTYQVDQNLASTGLKAGKTIVAQFNMTGGGENFGRFTIETVEFNDCTNPSISPFTKITVFDSVHGTGISPYATLPVGSQVRLYFGNDSVAFNTQNASDTSSFTNFKRFFEVYVDRDGKTFTHERARLNASGSTTILNSIPLYSTTALSFINLYRVSPKLRGYTFTNTRKINLQITSYSSSTGIFTGFLCKFDGSTVTNSGPTVTGKKGQITRFYDETHIDYIDFIFNIDDSVPDISITENIDVQLFSTLSLDDEIMLLGTCQVNDITKKVTYLKDERQFGNISEKQLSTSALNFITAGDRHLHQNGVIRGFDITFVTGNDLTIRGGTALVNGNMVQLNNSVVNIPLIQELYSSATYSKINWLLCVSNKNEFELIPITDYDAVAPATPNDPNRVFVAKNPLNSVTYSLESKPFLDIVNTRKDLTILYKITTQVDSFGALTSLTYADARKYSFEIDSLIPPVLTSEQSQGSFYNFDSLATWLTYNYKYFNNIGIKGNVTVSTTYDLSMPSGNSIKLNGNNISTITFNSGANVTFENFSFNDVPLVINSGAIVNFINCIFDPTTVTINNGSSVSINNCTFDSINLILNKSITLNGPSKFINTNTTVNVAKGFVINSDDVLFDKCTFTYNFDPTNPVDGYYSSSNKVNSESGMIYALNSSTFQRKNLSITNSKFINTTSDHYPFVSIEFNHIDAHYQDVLIKDNKFYSNTGTPSSPIDDQRAAISFMNNVTTGLSTLEGPRLVHARVEGNTFDKNQLITILSKADGSSNYNNALSTTNCHINNNICGAILFLNRYETKRNFANSSNLVRESESLLNISGNACKFIGTTGSSGDVSSPVSWSNVLIETGKTIITNNSIGYINTGLKGSDSDAQERRSSIIITNNNLAALPTGTFAAGAYSIIVNSAGTTNQKTGNAIISNNICDFGTTVNVDGTTKVVGYYTGGNLICSVPAIITNNIFRGIGNSTASPLNNFIVFVSRDSTISNNNFYRGSFSLGSTSGSGYIGLSGGDHSVVDNAFDSPTIDGTIEDLVKFFTANAVYERNKNQTGYAFISLLSNEKQWDTTSYAFINSTSGTSLGAEGAPHAKSILAQSIVQDTTLHFYNRIFSINGFVPYGVKLLELKHGIFSRFASTFDYGTDGNGNLTQFQMIVVSGITDKDAILDAAAQVTPSFGLGTQGVANTQTDTKAIASVGDQNSLQSTTQYLTLDLSALPQYYTVNNIPINISINHRFKLSSGSYIELYWSPIRVKYRW